MRALSDWGLNGVQALRGQVAVLVIVDVLSFSTAVDVALSRGAVVLPFPFGDQSEAERAAKAAEAVAASGRRAGGRFSLSPKTLTALEAGARLLLPSPNGSRLSLEGGPARVLTGCLRNAAAVARAALALASGGDIAVIPAGELWRDGGLRPAVEDLLGAGAILHALERPMSAEASVAHAAFQAVGDQLGEIVRGPVSGVELIAAGFNDDVEIALSLNASQVAPVLSASEYRPYAAA